MIDQPLARPLVLPGGLSLPNRLAKSAMSEVLGDADGGPTDRLVRLYERLGRGGAGLLITGHVIVAREGRGEPGNVLLEDARHLPALRRWAEAGQAHGSHVFVQLNHTGRQSPRRLTPVPVAPSAVGLRGFFGTFATPRALTGAEVEGLIGRFATAASLAKDAGFAGVQIHGAHGYLVSQFLSPLANRRDDEWGGSLENRMRFLLSIVRAMRAAVGPDYPIAVKLNSADFQRGGFELDDAKVVAQALEAVGVALLEISGGNYESPAMAGSGELPTRVRESTRLREAYFLEYAREIRAVTTLPLMLTGGMRTAATMNEVLASGAVDVIGLARPLTFEPDLPARLVSGAADGARPLKIHTGVKKIDDMLQVFWFQQQLHRMADGLEPDPGLGRFAALAHGVRHTLFASS
ncbi:MAG: NADH:flavin oxidoreductase/NADH oxidase family protein [Myxococcales bacterium]|nr:NADH:flavin oxidoreductase/NADH oxidase family protein [Myxococcales bacterium]